MIETSKVKKRNIINMLLNEDSTLAIQQRKEGKDSLSWLDLFVLQDIYLIPINK